MKKRIAFALCMILMVLMLGACGTDPTTVDYNGKSIYRQNSENRNNENYHGDGNKIFLAALHLDPP